MNRALVLVAAALAGFCLWRAFVHPPPPWYRFEFSAAAWLAAPAGEPQAYFRKTVHLPAPATHAWVALAAPDAYVLYVNGRAVAAKRHSSMTVSGMYDIAPYLQAGVNVLAVSARRTSYPGPARALLQGRIVDRSGAGVALASDESWRVSAVEERQAAGQVAWTSTRFDDARWRAAGVERSASGESVLLPVPAAAFTAPTRGKWLGGQGSFSSTVVLDHAPREAAIRVSAPRPYRVVINGRVVEPGEPREAPAEAVLAAERAIAWREPGAPATDVYDVSRLLRRGENRIVLSPAPSGPSRQGALLDGFATGRGGTTWFGTDAGWSATEPFAAGRALAVAEPATGAHRLPEKAAVALVEPAGALVVRALWLAALVAALALALHALLRFVREPALRRTLAGTYLVIIVPLAGALLLGLDVRVDPALAYRPWLLGAVLLAWAGVALCVAAEALLRRRRAAGAPGAAPPRAARAIVAIALVAIVALGAALRLPALGEQSLYHDEIDMLSYVDGLAEHGYPVKRVGPFERPLATYEALIYPVALSTALLGESEFAARLPAALLGVATIVAIFFVGRALFGAGAGLLAAAIFSASPQGLIWGKYLWHPQQTQFFALLTAFFVYRAFCGTEVRARPLYAGTGCAVLTYLSWEGSGFLFPALVAATIAMRGLDWSWARSRHAWIAAGVVGVVVAAQLGRRLLIAEPYLVVGTGLSNVTTPLPVFLQSIYDPTFYFRNFLWLEHNAPLTALALLGAPFLWRLPAFRFVLVLLLADLVLMGNLLLPAIRYVYHLEPLLILAAAAAGARLLAFLWDARGAETARSAAVARRGLAAAACAGLVVAPSAFAKLYRVNGFAHPTGLYVRDDTYYVDYRSAGRFLREHVRPGDRVISLVPDATRHYAGIQSDYFVETYPRRQLMLDPRGETPRYIERNIGTPTLTSLAELERVAAEPGRIWIVAVPYSLLYYYAGREVHGWIAQRARVAHESYDARVYVLQR